jgi:hypothetical protein
LLHAPEPADFEAEPVPAERLELVISFREVCPEALRDGEQRLGICFGLQSVDFFDLEVRGCVRVEVGDEATG